MSKLKKEKAEVKVVCRDYTHTEEMRILREYAKRLSENPEEKRRVMEEAGIIDGQGKFIRRELAGYR